MTNNATFDGADIGSPGHLPGITQGDCSNGGPLRDGNGDGVVDMMDYSHFFLCCAGPGEDPPLNCGCFDDDGDGDVDLEDFRSFQIGFEGS